jgi:hypothetical protein
MKLIVMGVNGKKTTKQTAQSLWVLLDWVVVVVAIGKEKCLHQMTDTEPQW